MATKFTVDQVIDHIGEDKITQMITEMYDFAMQRVCRLFHPRLQIIMNECEYSFCASYLFPCFIYFSVRNTIDATMNGCDDDTTLEDIERIFHQSSLYAILHEACHSTQANDVIEKVYSYSINDPSYENIIEEDNNSRTMQVLRSNATYIMKKFNIDIETYNLDLFREGFLPLKDISYVDFVVSLAETFMAHPFESMREYNNARFLSDFVRTAVRDPYTVLIFDVNEKEIIMMGSDCIVDGASPDETIDWLIENKFYVMNRTIRRIEVKDDSTEEHSFNVVRVEVELEIEE